jgi:hypothetical protein
MLQIEFAIKIRSIGIQLSKERQLLLDAFKTDAFFEVKRGILAKIRKMEFSMIQLEKTLTPFELSRSGMN